MTFCEMMISLLRSDQRLIVARAGIRVRLKELRLELGGQLLADRAGEVQERGRAIENLEGTGSCGFRLLVLQQTPK